MFRAYEHRSEPLLPFPQFVARFLRHLVVAVSFMAAALLIGVTVSLYAAGVVALRRLLALPSAGTARALP